MSGEFDPYYQWLGIPPTQQPPSHYRLLGLADYEPNPDVIENAADRQMAHLRNYQSGKHADAAQQLLNEISAAKLCLLAPERKSAYDAQQESNRAAHKQERSLKSAAPPPRAKPAVAASESQIDPIGAMPAPQWDQGQPSGGWMIAPLVVAIGGGVLALFLLVAGLAAFVLLFRSSPDSDPVAVAPEPAPPVDPVRRSPPRRPSPRQPVNNPPPNRIPGPSDPPPVVLNPNRPQPTPPPTPEPVGPLRPTASLEPPEVSPPEAAPEAEQPLASFFPPEQEDRRAPIPDEAARAAIRKQIDDVFAPSDARTYQEKVKVAQDLLQTGRESRGDPAAQYALFQRAQEIAGDAGDLNVAFEAIDKLDAQFQIDGDALRIASVSAAATAPAPPSVRKESVNAGMKLVDRLFAGQRYKDAAQVIDELQSIARKTPDRRELQQLGQRKQLGSELFAAYRAADDSIAKLKADPGDKAAAAAAGRYFVFAKGDWQLGLPMLAAGDDEALKQIAEQEMAAPREVDARKNLADAWRALAQTSSGIEARRQNARAAMWYQRIVGQLSGLAKIEVEKQLEDIGELAASGGAPYQRPGSATSQPPDPAGPPLGKPIDLLATINTDRDAARGEWGFFGQSVLVARPAALGRLQVPYTPPDAYTLELKVTRVSGSADLAIGLIYRGAPCHVIIDGWNGTAAGITAMRGGRPIVVGKHDATYLRQGQRNTILCLVGGDGFVVNCNGREILRHVGPPLWDAMNTGWRVPDETQLALGVNQSEFHFHTLQVTPLSAAGLPPKAAAPPSTDGRMIDLLAMLDPIEHAVAGRWQKQNGELITPPTQFARMQIPFQPPEEYDLEIEASRLSGSLELSIGLIYQGRQCHMAIDRYQPPVTQMVVDKKSLAPRDYVATYKGQGHTLFPRRRTKIKCEVRRDAVRLFVNDKKLLEFTGRASWEGINEEWLIPDKQALMIGSWSSRFQIHSMKLTPPGAGAAEPVDLLSLVDPSRDFVSGRWRANRSGVGSNIRLLSSNDDYCEAHIPFLPAGEYDLDAQFAVRQEKVDFQIKLPYGGTEFNCNIDSSSPVVVGRPRTLRCEVRRSGIKLYLDGKLAAERPRNPQAGPFQPNTKPFRIITKGTIVEVSHFRITEIGARGKPLR